MIETAPLYRLTAVRTRNPGIVYSGTPPLCAAVCPPPCFPSVGPFPPVPSCASGRRLRVPGTHAEAPSRRGLSPPLSALLFNSDFVCTWGCCGVSYFGGLLPFGPCAWQLFSALFCVWRSGFGLCVGSLQLDIWLDMQ